MGTIHDFCSQALEQLDTEGVITLDLFEEVIIAAHRTHKILAAATSSALGVTESTSFEMDISKSLDAGALTPLTLGHTATPDADLNDCPLSVDLSPVLSISPPSSPPLFPNRTATTCDNHPDWWSSTCGQICIILIVVINWKLERKAKLSWEGNPKKEKYFS